MKRKPVFILCGVAMATMAMVRPFAKSDGPANAVELGKQLFFDPILSGDSTISCASCHKPAFAFADTSAVSRGVADRPGTRNTPSAMNLRIQQVFFWDGRASSLEQQALKPIANPVEMNLPIEEAVMRLKRSATYSSYFRRLFNAEPDSINLAKAIAAFERTLETSNSPFDNWKFYDNAKAVSDAVKRGFIVFSEKGKCTKCHFGSDFTQHEFRNIGLFDGKELNDSGRLLVSGKAEDLGKFKTPGLRNIAVTAPYMHDGRFKTLKEVIEFYNETEKFVQYPINKDTALAKPLGLTDGEKADLEAFLISLTDQRFRNP